MRDDVRALEDRHASGGVPRRDAVIVRAEGCRLFDEQGGEFLDFASAHGWALLGHNHPAVTDAIQAQAARLVAVTESAYNDRRAQWFAELAVVLSREFPATDRGALSRIVPCNSGTEATEAAIKIARALTGRTDFVAFQRGFHGRTLGALSATANPRFRDPFQPLVPGFEHLPFGRADRLDAIDERTAGVILEVVQGEGGVHVAAPAFLAGVRAACDAAGALLIVDEIQTGLGRTGRWFGCGHFDLAPDVLLLGKGLGGGIPMGAAVWRDGLGKLAPGTHGSTFGGNPLACAAGTAVLRTLAQEALPQRAAQLGARTLEALSRAGATAVREVRGLGLMVGVQLKSDVKPVLDRLMTRGVWALPAGRSVLRLLPPLSIADEELANGLDVIVETLRAA